MLFYLCLIFQFLCILLLEFVIVFLLLFLYIIIALSVKIFLTSEDVSWLVLLLCILSLIGIIFEMRLLIWELIFIYLFIADFSPSSW